MHRRTAQNCFSLQQILVNYSDGTSEEVYGFDVPVPALDKEFDLALIGTKGTWYDHKVSVIKSGGSRRIKCICNLYKAAKKR